MEKKSRLRQIVYKDKTYKFAEPIYVQLKDKYGNPRLDRYVYADIIIEVNKTANKYKEFVDIILKHMTNNGWSNDYTIDFWNMKPNELKKIEEMYKEYNKDEIHNNENK